MEDRVPWVRRAEEGEGEERKRRKGRRREEEGKSIVEGVGVDGS